MGTSYRRIGSDVLLRRDTADWLADHVNEMFYEAEGAGVDVLEVLRNTYVELCGDDPTQMDERIEALRAEQGICKNCGTTAEVTHRVKFGVCIEHAFCRTCAAAFEWGQRKPEVPVIEVVS